VDECKTRTVAIGDARGNERWLRVTWHPDTQTVVFSHWNGEVCSASTPVHLADATKVAELVLRALRNALDGQPKVSSVAQTPRRDWFEKLRRAAKPQMAKVMSLHHRPAASAAEPTEPTEQASG
jgi:hypothetical protein